ncbi:MAG: hypothetical protein WJ289_05700 [Ferrovum myxofaciens]|nr:hypothetical protein [Ferrovum myxofaciens]
MNEFFLIWPKTWDWSCLCYDFRECDEAPVTTVERMGLGSNKKDVTWRDDFRPVESTWFFVQFHNQIHGSVHFYSVHIQLILLDGDGIAGDCSDHFRHQLSVKSMTDLTMRDKTKQLPAFDLIGRGQVVDIQGKWQALTDLSIYAQS